MRTLIGLLMGAVLLCGIGASVYDRNSQATTAETVMLDSVPLGTPQSVVHVIVPGTGMGTGFYIGNGQFVTAGHVAQMAEDGSRITLKYQRQDGATFETTAVVVWIDKGHDVALLQSDTIDAVLAIQGVRKANLACSVPDDAIGTSLVSIGYPLAAGLHYAWGHVASRPMELPLNPFPEFKGNKYLGTDLMVAPGNSGGPVFDRHGYVVGLADMIMKYSNLSFLIPRSTICNSLNNPPATPVAP